VQDVCVIGVPDTFAGEVAKGMRNEFLSCGFTSAVVPRLLRTGSLRTQPLMTLESPRVTWLVLFTPTIRTVFGHTAGRKLHCHPRRFWRHTMSRRTLVTVDTCIPNCPGSFETTQCDYMTARKSGRVADGRKFTLRVILS
jgi:hypothetical protein